MKKISLLEIVVVVIVSLVVMFMCKDTYATDNTNDYNDLGNFVISGNNTNNSSNTNKNTNTNTNTNVNTNTNTNNTNTNKNTNSSSYNNTNTNTLPKTGIDGSQSGMLLFAGIAAVSAVFAYKKMRDYRDL